MARTKGAKDKGKRKAATKPTIRRPVTTPPGASQSPPVDRPPIPESEFTAAIAAELGKTDTDADQASRAAGQGPAVPAGSPNPAPPSPFDPSALTMQAMADALQLPFYAMAWLLSVLGIAPDPDPVTAVGKIHAPALAKAVYPIYDYYARQYIGEHPDQAVNACIHVSILDGVAIVPDLVEAVRISRINAAAARAQQQQQRVTSVPGAQRQPGQCPEPSVN